jgi:uncharacterized protein (DUF927 family)
MADIPADAGAGIGAFEEIHGRKTPAAFAEELEANTCKHYGAIGAAWLRRIVDDVAKLPGILNDGIRDFIAEAVLPAGASGQIYRVARRFALVAAAGELATRYGLTGWRKGESDTAAKKCFAAWFEAFGGAGNKEEQNILSQVKLFFETHGSSRFEAMNATTEQNVINRVGYWRDKLDHDERGNETTRREFLVTTEAFRHVICKGQDVALVTKVLVQKGWIAPGGDGRPTQKLRGVPRCYVFTDRMFEDES